MEAKAIHTRPLYPPQDTLIEVLDALCSDLSEGSILAVSSKVVAIWQGRCIPIPKDEHEAAKLKADLIRKEADWYLEKDEQFPYSRLFTINEGIFGSSSGIDESNGNGYFVLLPKDATRAAHDIRNHMCAQHSLTSLGVLIVDSRTQPMRNGVVGVALGHAGFRALCDYRGTEDIFGRKLRFERLNTADCLATTATLLMGEGNECTPCVIFKDVPHITFGDEVTDDPLLSTSVPLEEDVFAQFFKPHQWQRGTRYNTK